MDIYSPNFSNISYTKSTHKVIASGNCENFHIFTEQQGRSHVSIIAGVHLSFLHNPYKRPTTAVKSVDGREMGGSPPQPTRGLGSVVGCLIGVWGGAPSANDFGAFHVQFYAISRTF